MRIAFINAITGHFRIPLMREIAVAEGLDVTVFHSRSSLCRFWEQCEPGFAYHLLPGYNIIMQAITGRGILHINPTLPFELIKGKYDVIIAFTWSQPSSL